MVVCMHSYEMGYTKTTSKPGNGVLPKRGDKITVHCTGIVAATNKKFWSTKDPGQQPFSFNVGKEEVIRGWDEGMMTMSVGEVARLTCSPEYAYGDGGFPAWGIPPKAELHFDIEMLKIN